MHGTLHPDEIEDLLYRRHVGHLACIAEGRPYVVPITYAYAGGCVYGHTQEGRKIDALRLNPHVCFEVAEQVDVATWGSVVAEGVYDELTEPEERQLALRLLANVFPAAVPAGTTGVLFRLHLTEKTGRFIVSEP